MSNLVVPGNLGAVSRLFGNDTEDRDDLASGIQASFGLIGFKGKVWSIRHRGVVNNLMRPDGDGPRGSIEVVILQASSVVAKNFYLDAYAEGSNEAPDCYSLNGIVPEANSRHLQNNACQTCRHNQWGSRVTDAGKQAKACADNKRLAVVPLGDIRNEALGGPLLLRVPAASLQDLAKYGNDVRGMGFPYYALGTKISFDPNAAFPKFKFEPIRALNDQEAQLVIEMRANPQVERVVSEKAVNPVATPGVAQQPVPQLQGGPSRLFNDNGDRSSGQTSSPRMNTSGSDTGSTSMSQTGEKQPSSTQEPAQAAHAQATSGTPRSRQRQQDATTTGQGAAQPAQAAGSTAAIANLGSGQGSQPSPAATQAQGRNGGAGTASQTPSSASRSNIANTGFGPMEAMEPEPAASLSDFEKELDAHMENLLPPRK